MVKTATNPTSSSSTAGCAAANIAEGAEVVRAAAAAAAAVVHHLGPVAHPAALEVHHDLRRVREGTGAYRGEAEV